MSEWPVVALSEVAEVSSGDGAPQDASAFGESGKPFIRAGSLVPLLGGQPESKLEMIPEAESSARRMRLYPPHTIVFAKSGMSCTKGLVYELKGSAHVVNHLAALECSGDLNPRFLLRWFQMNSPARLIANDAYPSIKISAIRTEQIPLPPLAEQKRIAGILDAADALRARRRESLAQLDTLLQSTFLEMFGDPVTNPMGWEEKSFGDIAEDTKIGLVRSSKEFGWDFGIPYVRMDAVTTNGDFLPEKVQFTDANKDETGAFALRPGDFLFNTRNSKELVGKVCVFPGPEGWLFNNNLMRVRFCAGIEPTVVAMQFRFNRVKSELEKRKSGTTSVFAVYWKSLKTLPVLVPSVNLQQRFAAIVESVEQQKVAQRAHLMELDTLFAALQQRAFGGEL